MEEATIWAKQGLADRRVQGLVVAEVCHVPSSVKCASDTCCDCVHGQQ